MITTLLILASYSALMAIVLLFFSGAQRASQAGPTELAAAPVQHFSKQYNATQLNLPIEPLQRKPELTDG